MRGESREWREEPERRADIRREEGAAREMLTWAGMVEAGYDKVRKLRLDRNGRGSPRISLLRNRMN